MEDQQLTANPGNYGPQTNQEGEVITSNEPFFVKLMAHAVSVIFHPLFIPSYIAAFLIYVHPYAFAGFDDKMKLMRLASVIVSTALLPAFSVFLLWRLDFISSIYLRTQRERIVPYAIAMIFYFWVWYVFRNLSDSPMAIKDFLLGVFLAVCGSWMANILFKVSMHGTAVGGMAMFLLLQSLKDPMMGGSFLAMGLFIAGLVCTARLIVGSHSRHEVYFGLFVGAVAQLAAAWL